MVQAHQNPETAPSDDGDQAEALAQLSAQLISAGFLRQPLPPTTFNGGSMEGQKHLMKAIWSMFGSRSKEMVIREGLMAKQRELSYEHTRLEGFLQNAEKEKLEAQQEATASTNRANAAQKELELEKARHRNTKDDYSKLKNAERLIKTTSIHELRKKNNELEELQRRLTKLSTNKELVIASSLSLGPSGPLSAKIDSGGGGRVGLLEFDLKASRDQNNQLQIENARLREYLELYEQQLADLISEITDQTESESLKCRFNDSDEQLDENDRWIKTTTSNRLEPLAKIYKRLSLITYKLRDKAIENFRLLKELNDKLSQSNSVVEQERIRFDQRQKKLCLNFEKEIEMLKLSLTEAQSTIERWTNSDLANGPSSINAMEDVTFEKISESPKLSVEIDALATERKKIAQEAIGLAKERAEIEMRKFNEQRQKILEELDMNMNPGIPISSSKTTNEQKSCVKEKAEEGDKTLESLVTFTKPNSIKKTSTTKPGKLRSSISKNLGTVHRVKLQNPIKTKPVPNRNGVLKSLLSMTGEEDKINQNSSSLTTTRIPEKNYHLDSNHRILNPASDSTTSLSKSNKNSHLLPRRPLNLGQSTSRLTRPTNRPI